MKLDCGHEPSEHSECTTGYGTDREGKTYCYACCAERDKADMIETGRATLYLTMPDNHPTKPGNMWGYHYAEPIPGDCTVSNWPGSLKLKTHCARVGGHNMTGKRYDVWFTGPDGANWHGVQYGDNTQICHCRRLKN